MLGSSRSCACGGSISRLTLEFDQHVAAHHTAKHNYKSNTCRSYCRTMIPSANPAASTSAVVRISVSSSSDSTGGSSDSTIPLIHLVRLPIAILNSRANEPDRPQAVAADRSFAAAGRQRRVGLTAGGFFAAGFLPPPCSAPLSPPACRRASPPIPAAGASFPAGPPWRAASVSLGLPSLSKCLANRPSLRAEVDEVDLLARLGIRPPVVVHRRIALQRQPLADRVALAGIVDQQRERPRIDRQAGLVGGHVVGHAVLGLAGRVAADDRRAVELQRVEHRLR